MVLWPELARTSPATQRTPAQVALPAETKGRPWDGARECWHDDERRAYRLALFINRPPFFLLTIAHFGDVEEKSSGGDFTLTFGCNMLSISMRGSGAPHAIMVNLQEAPCRKSRVL
jgi:hypothetical protein